jgi:hypothetical protein
MMRAMWLSTSETGAVRALLSTDSLVVTVVTRGASLSLLNDSQAGEYRKWR